MRSSLSSSSLSLSFLRVLPSFSFLLTFISCSISVLSAIIYLGRSPYRSRYSCLYPSPARSLSPPLSILQNVLHVEHTVLPLLLSPPRSSRFLSFKSGSHAELSRPPCPPISFGSLSRAIVRLRPARPFLSPLSLSLSLVCARAARGTTCSAASRTAGSGSSSWGNFRSQSRVSRPSSRVPSSARPRTIAVRSPFDRGPMGSRGPDRCGAVWHGSEDRAEKRADSLRRSEGMKDGWETRARDADGNGSIVTIYHDFLDIAIQARPAFIRWTALRLASRGIETAPKIRTTRRTPIARAEGGHSKKSGGAGEAPAASNDSADREKLRADNRPTPNRSRDRGVRFLGGTVEAARPELTRADIVKFVKSAR